MKPCIKQRFRSRDDAIGKGGQVMRSTLDAQFFNAYQCRRCRFQGGQRAWHWGHKRVWMRGRAA